MEETRKFNIFVNGQKSYLQIKQGQHKICNSFRESHKQEFASDLKFVPLFIELFINYNLKSGMNPSNNNVDMKTTQLSQASLYRRQRNPGHQNNRGSLNQTHSEGTRCCCCCINYNLFALGLSYSLGKQSYNPGVLNACVEPNNRKIKKESEGQKQIGIHQESSPSGLATKDHQNKGSLEGQAKQKQSQLPTNAALKAQTNQMDKIQQNLNLSNQNKGAYEQSKDTLGTTIYKINNLGEQSQNNSSPLMQQKLDHQQNKHESPQVLETDTKQEAELKQKQNVSQKQDQNRQQIYFNSSELQRPMGKESSNLIEKSSQPLINQTHQPDYLSQILKEDRQIRQQRQYREGNYQNNSDQSDREQEKFPLNQEQEKQESFSIQKLEQKQQELVLSVNERSNSDHQQQDNRLYAFQEAKNQYKSSYLNAKHKIKQEIIEQLQQIPQDYEEQSVQIIKDIVQQDVFHPYSQPESHRPDQQVPVQQIYSLDQHLQHKHEEFSVEKSKNSRYNKKLDQDLLSEQRKQFTQIESLNKKLQKQQGKSQSNPPKFRKFIQSKQQRSQPLPEIKSQNLKQKQQGSRSEDQERFKEQSQQNQNAYEIQQACDQGLKLSQSCQQQPKTQKEEYQPISGGLFSEDQNESSSHIKDLPKKQEEEQAYAVISIQDEIKKQNILVEVEKLEQPEDQSVSNKNNDFLSYSVSPSQEDQLPEIKQENKLEISVPASSQNQEIKQDTAKLVKLDDEDLKQPQNQQALQRPIQSLSAYSNNNICNSDSLDQQQSQAKIEDKRLSEEQFQKEEKREDQEIFSEDQSQQGQILIEKKAYVPKISKKMAMELKKQSKYQRRSSDGDPSSDCKAQNLAITKTIELNINKSVVASNSKQADKDKQPKSSKIQIANQFSFFQGGSSEKHKQKVKTQYIRQEDYDPEKYQEIQEVIYKVVRRSKPKYKKRVIEQIYEPIQVRKGSTKKLAREHTRKRYETVRDNTLTIPSDDEIQQIPQVYHQEQSISYNQDDSEVCEYPKPPAYRSKKRKERVRYIYVDELPKNKKYSRIIEQSSSSFSEEQKRTRKRHSSRRVD